MTDHTTEKARCRCTAQGGGVYDAACPLHAGEQERLAAEQRTENWNPNTAGPDCDWCGECSWCDNLGRVIPSGTIGRDDA